ncbi:MerR family transcriptional regulator [Actinomadura rupiterrae]|uniref:MerR family transcriptional regulator n=1 Tax=Actinomadura rupiterrae TaxID=559627 RepID=UPI0020A605FE|nr:MerR family transcriptional regulator [Actinomadura rupiterrae]MCP2341511.1 DNA-binding transcriptional MerR regulator [Actinomadura rupiterrae]
MTNHGLTIADAAARTGLTVHTLRYYERDGLLLGVSRAESGHRRYTEHDLDWIDLISKLRATGMPIREIRRYAEAVRNGAGNERERLELLAAHRERVRRNLAEAMEHLAAIDRKIDYHTGAIATCEGPDTALSEPRRAAAADRR